MPNQDGPYSKPPSQQPAAPLNAAPRRFDWQRTSIIGLFAIAMATVLYAAKAVFIPIMGAFLLSLLFAPLIRPFIRRGAPAPLCAAVVMLMLISLLIFIGTLVSSPTIDWFDRLPSVAQELNDRLRSLKSSMDQVREASKGVIDLGGAADKAAPSIKLEDGSGTERILEAIQQVSYQLLVIVVMLFFLLATHGLMKEKLVHLMPDFSHKKSVVATAYRLESHISTYLLTITLINIGLGGAVAGALYAIGLKNPVFWGVVAGLMNFIPYLGFILGLALVAIAAILQFDSLSYAALAPFSYALLNLIESNFITPGILGERFRLNPLVLFLSVVAWGWLWGIPGALMAVPIMVAVNVIAAEFPSLRPIHILMTGRP